MTAQKDLSKFFKVQQEKTSNKSDSCDLLVQNKVTPDGIQSEQLLNLEDSTASKTPAVSAMKKQDETMAAGADVGSETVTEGEYEQPIDDIPNPIHELNKATEGCPRMMTKKQLLELSKKAQSKFETKLQKDKQQAKSKPKSSSKAGKTQTSLTNSFKISLDKAALPIIPKE